MKRVLLVLLLSCAPPHRSAEERGRLLFASTKASTAASNPFSCATCHTNGPGGSLAGVTKRTSFWGGQRLDLLESVNDCRLSFMDARTPWTRDDAPARDLYAYLASTSGPTGIAFTPASTTTELPPGDRARGAKKYATTCAPCHGAANDGENRIASFVPILPNETKLAHTGSPPAELRQAFRKKIREGAFAGRSGSMPPFGEEALSDSDVASILEYLGL